MRLLRIVGEKKYDVVPGEKWKLKDLTTQKMTLLLVKIEIDRRYNELT